MSSLKTNQLTKTYPVCIMSALLGLSLFTHKSQAGLVPGPFTVENLSVLELPIPDLTEEEAADLRETVELEADSEYLQQVYEDRMNQWDFVPTLGKSDHLQVEIYQNAPSIGKQFLLLRQNGHIRFVFAISAAAADKITPGGEFGIEAQLWRHMSSKYPSRGENNMDHVSYFRGPIAFHATTFGAYSKLGRRDSHGCVRMGRPEARAVYRTIKANNSAATVLSYRSKMDPPKDEIALIKSQLAKDLNFISYMITNHLRGDVPWTESQYNAYRNGNTEVLKLLKGAKPLEIPADQDLGVKPASKLVSL